MSMLELLAIMETSLMNTTKPKIDQPQKRKTSEGNEGFDDILQEEIQKLLSKDRGQDTI